MSAEDTKRTADSVASSEPVPALVVMHGDLARAMVGAVGQIYGATDRLDALSNEGLSRDALQSEIERRVVAWAHGGLVCVDFPGSSCHVAAACIARRHDILVVTGCHLGMLLDYMHNRVTADKTALAERLCLKGHESIVLQRGAGR